MARIDRAEVARIADLARLDLSDDQAQRMTAELEAILAHAEALREVDTEGVEPTAHVLARRTPLREDRAEPPLAPERVLANAPAREGFAFVVPKVLAEDEL
jgi:aspartyl-tRNA(Asn)/glutamyl-tRNA(Gln) amidotransferase subunit C